MDPKKTWFGPRMTSAAAIAALCFGMLSTPALADDKDGVRTEPMRISNPAPVPPYADTRPEPEAPQAPRATRNMVRIVSEFSEEIENLQEDMVNVEGRIENLTNEYNYAMADSDELSSRERRGMEHEFQMEMNRLQADLRSLDAQINRLQAETSFRATQSVTAHTEVRTDRNVVRMVTDYEEGETTTRMCVFVPAGNGEAGILSCDGDEDVRIVDWAQGNERTVMIGDDVLDESDLRDLIEDRMEAIADRLDDVGEIRIEYLDRAEETEELHEEMRELREDMREREMEMREVERERASEARERAREQRHERTTTHRIEIEFTEEELEDFEEEMREFQQEMEEFGREMAGLQAEVMSELSESLGANFGEDFGEDFGADMAEFGENMAEWALEMSRTAMENDFAGTGTLLRVIDDDTGDYTVVETVVDEEGNTRLVIHTTDPSSIDIIPVEKGSRVHEH